MVKCPGGLQCQATQDDDEACKATIDIIDEWWQYDGQDAQHAGIVSIQVWYWQPDPEID